VGKRANKTDPLSKRIEVALCLGQFISYGASYEFIRGLEEVKSEIDFLVENGEAERAIGLYELFLSGCHEKAEEIDDSDGALGDFFQELFIAWINARQRAGREPKETVRQLLKWKDHDDYGFLHGNEGDVANALDQEDYALFVEHYANQLERALKPSQNEERSQSIDDYPPEAYLPIKALKSIYLARKDLTSYQALCERFVLSPKDCERIATLHQAKRRYPQALAWVEKGLHLEETHNWGNESSYSLSDMRRDLLAKTGRKSEALAGAWAAYRKAPSLFAYTELIRRAPKIDRKTWRDKALAEAGQTSLGALIEIGVKTKEFDLLAHHLETVDGDRLEHLSHYVTEKAAKALAKRYPSSSVKLYRALGMRILKSGKSKYYDQALEHFREIKNLSRKTGNANEWEELVNTIRYQHARKRGFITRFENLVEGRSIDLPASFERRARANWRKKTT
jgi:tetratricopeptide (TPR) repeat protein